ncbi:hypothetical protein K437DRAFT_274746 [Tilletiaria anomala UBC 951]|uniref:non-specific serine/threonine protein kinase n=1 Tax=Tilletiaria anomala (strain ATCC 24038 / CBS 436.72 / UBC 951) TaxID=1037660 RepID=A0A066VUM3_TILAU|nr:uncharacterized protein K437DRAFT_274746 [Tilletiaria anomala UBC 951]KDN43973.1 hypothetical protein K437DRAFT_274746 [Tilletiaria anomala UBC 951]
MGNAASTNTRLAGFSNLVGELGNDVQYERSMGDSRFLKAIKARHSSGPLVVKTFYKPPEADAGLSLDDLVRRLKQERMRLADAPNVLAYQTVVETDNAGYLIRQWLASSLYDRISTRPFLSVIEKKWLSFQLLQGMATATARDVPHGDLKSENILVTSSLVLYISDFASSIKPTYLPLDDPDDFGVFFDTSGRRSCYLAPERFFESTSKIARDRAAQRTAGQKRASAAATAGATAPTAPSTSPNWSATMTDPYNIILGNGGQTRREGNVTEQMDLFAAGCVIAELWRDGSPTFTLSQLFQYLRGALDIEPVLAHIPDTHVRSMVHTMLSVNPRERGTFAGHLRQQRNAAFPELFYEFYYPYLTSLQRSSAVPAQVPSSAAKPTLEAAAVGYASIKAAVTTATQEGEAESEQSSRRTGYAPATAFLHSESDERLERLYEDWSVIVEKLIDQDMEAHGGQRWSSAEAQLSNPSHFDDPRRIADSVYPVALHIPGVPPQSLRVRVKSPIHDGPALILLSIILSNLRNASRPSIRKQALEMGMHLANGHLTDLTKLDRLLPYIIALFDDPSPPVRVAACCAATQVLMLVDSVNAANATIFSEYIVPHFRHLASDPSVLVRTAYAASLAHLCNAAKDHVARLQSEEQESHSASRILGADADLHDSQLKILHNFFQVEVVSLLTDPSTNVKLTLLADIDKLTTYFGAVVTNDILLSHMITYLNDNDWRLRESFFEAILHVGTIATSGSLENYILPLMLQALSDEEEAVVQRVLDGLIGLMSIRKLPDANIYEIIESTVGFLCHPNLWLRYQGASLLVACMHRMHETERWAFAYPHLRPLLSADVPDLMEISLLEVLKPPLSRLVFNSAVSWAAKVPSSLFWKFPENAKRVWPIDNALGTQGLALMAGCRGSSIPPLQMPRNEEDDGQMDRLRAIGMSKDDEIKLVALRSVVRRLAKQGSAQLKAVTMIEGSTPAPLISERYGVAKLDGVNSQNIFFNSKVTARQVPGSRSEEASVVSRSLASDNAGSFARQLARKRIAGRLASETSHLDSDDARRQRLQIFLNPDVMLSNEGPKTGDARSETTVTHHVGSQTPQTASVPGRSDGLLHVESSIQGSSDAIDAAEAKSRQLAAEEDPVFSTYDGKDPYLRAHLEFMHQHRSRMRASINNMKRVQGSRAKPRLSDGSSRYGAPSNTRPDGKLVAYFNEHTKPITVIVVSPDQVFFVTASEDSTLRVWDTARLERNVTSRSRAQYTGHNGGVTACIALSQPRCFASTSKDGSLHVWRIEITNSAQSMPKYASRPKLVSNFQYSDPSEYATCIFESTHECAAALVMGTSRGRITVVDLRTMQVLRTFRNPVHTGAITSTCEDPQRQWLLNSTESGHLCLWDMRFGLLIRTWPVLDESQRAYYRITRCTNHPRPDQQNVVLVGISSLGLRPPTAISASMVEIWDIQSATKLSSFEARSNEHSARPSRTASPAPPRHDVVNTQPTASQAIEALLSGTAAGMQSEDPGSSLLSLNPIPDTLALLASIDGYRSSAAAVQGLDRDWVDAGVVARGAGLSSATSAGWLLTAGRDRTIRWWDLGKVERSKTVAPAIGKDDFQSRKINDGCTEYIQVTHPAVKPTRSQRSLLLAPTQARDSSEAMSTHRDAITALGVLETPFRCIIAGDRSGRIMIWE